MFQSPSPAGRLWGRRKRGIRVHDDCTRAAPDRRQTGIAMMACLAAAFLFTVANAGQALSAASSAASGVTSVPKDGGAHDVAIVSVRDGQEALELSARLTDDGGLIQRPILWTIRDANGEKLFSGEVPMADLPARPGEYAIEAIYGTVRIAHGITLLPGNRMHVSFVLNAGGLRVMPRIEGIALASVATETRIFARTGSRAGQLVATSRMPGEVLRVEAGDYRVESRFAAGNAIAVADVHVRPGLMSAVEIDHRAGLARLSLAHSANTGVLWKVTDQGGATLSEVGGAAPELVLKPGNYVANASVNGKEVTASFEIGPGETRDVIVGK